MHSSCYDPLHSALLYESGSSFRLASVVVHTCISAKTIVFYWWNLLLVLCVPCQMNVFLLAFVTCPNLLPSDPSERFGVACTRQSQLRLIITHSFLLFPSRYDRCWFLAAQMGRETKIGGAVIQEDWSWEPRQQVDTFSQEEISWVEADPLCLIHGRMGRGVRL